MLQNQTINFEKWNLNKCFISICDIGSIIFCHKINKENGMRMVTYGTHIYNEKKMFVSVSKIQSKFDVKYLIF